MSDRVPGATTLEERMDDIRAVMDAVGSERAAVIGESEGGPLAMLFAAAHPERTVGLILQGAEVRERRDDDWPWGEATDEEAEAYYAALPERWGKGLGFEYLVPSVGDVEWGRAWLGRLAVHAATPASWEAFARMAHDIDVRHVAPAINVPTLIVHAAEDQICHVENARFLARTIPGARYVELPGGDHVPWFDPDATLAEIREFLTGTREAATPTGCWPPCSSPTSSARRRVPPSSAIAAGGTSSSSITRRSDASSLASTGTRWTRPATASSRRSTARRERSGAHRRSSRAVRPLGLDVRAGLHTGEVELADGKIAGIAVNIGARVAAQADARRGARVRHGQGPRRRAPASSSRIAAPPSLKGVPGEWRLFAVAPRSSAAARA